MSRGKRILGPPKALLVADPFFLAFAPYVFPGQTGPWEYVGFFAATLGLSALLTVLALGRMRVVTVRESGRGDRILRLGGRMMGVRLMRRYVYDVRAGDESRWIRLRMTVRR